MPLPNFLVLGTAKAGTASLFRYLRSHPQVFMSRFKEPRFFAFQDEVMAVAGPSDERLQQESFTHLEDYQALFEGVSGELATGESSCVYLYSPSAPACIKRWIPEAKLIAILRHPVDRAWSAFQAHRQQEIEPLEDFEEAVRAEPRRIQDGWSFVWHYMQRGFYAAQLQRYFDLFDSEQIRVFLYEDWARDNALVLREIFAFLGCDPSFVPDLGQRRNVIGIPTPMDVRARLIPHFQTDIRRLQDLLRRDLSTWLVP